MSILSSFADSSAGKLLGLFVSDKDVTSSPLIIPTEDTLRPDVFPSVDCSSLCDTEVEVLHLRGVNKCRKRGRAQAVNSDSSDMASERRSSPESGYRSAVSGLSGVSTDVSNDSLSLPSSSLTSPPSNVVGSTSSGRSVNAELPHAVYSELAELHPEVPPIVTRTAAEDELIRSILEDHCKSVCASAVADRVLPVGAEKDPAANSDAFGSLPIEISSLTDQCTSVEENTDTTLDVVEEESGEKVEPVAETAFADCKRSVAAEEISIYDDGISAVWQQHGSVVVREAVVEFATGLSDCSSRQKQEQTSCLEPASSLVLADTDSLASDTKLSRTSSVSSALSLELISHSAEVRYVGTTAKFAGYE